MRKLTSIFLISLTFQSCDPYSHGYVCNQTKDDIELTMVFDTTNQAHLTKKEFLRWLPDQFDNSLKLNNFDTVKLIGTYTIETGKCALVGHGMNGYPPFWFSQLTIKTINGSKTYTERDKFEKRDEGFKIGFGGNYDLIVK